MFKQFIEGQGVTSLNIQELIGEALFEKTVRKGEYFLRAEENMNQVGFVCSGLFRYFYIDPQGREATKFFVAESDFVLSFAALMQGRAPFFIEALEDSSLLCVETKRLLQLIGDDPQWLRLYTTLLEQSYLIKEQREADFLFLSGTQRYVKFLRENPGLAERIPLKYLAGYLGITPVSLSRIRKKLSNDNY